MRLLDTHTGQFIEKDPEDGKTIYAILSHAWDRDGEQTYEQLRNIQRRYSPLAQDDSPVGPEGGSSSSRKWNQGGTSWTSTSSQHPGESISGTTHPEEALEHLIQSKMEDLFHDFVRTHGVAIRTPAAASIWEDPELSPKIREACRVARENGYDYIWIDSCCIDKSSSSELSEAINSMYKWYGLADVCYAYLADVPPGEDYQAKGSAFRKSRWFIRGWTLQELIAPLSVKFLSKDWASIGSKLALVNLVESVTRVTKKALLHLEPLDTFSVAQRLSWAAERKTTRVEDQAYSLLGIFDINMPTLYGEGDRAFRRLQEQIMQRIPDQSLFAWGDLYRPGFYPLPSNLIPIHNPIILTAEKSGSPSAASPDKFKDSGNIRHVQLPASHHHEIVYTLTSYGIRAQFQMIPLTSNLLTQIFLDSTIELELPDHSSWYLAILGCEHSSHPRHLLGRVCYILSSNSGIDLMYAGYIDWDPSNSGIPMPDLFLLSPETIERCRPQTELKTVYIPHPNHATLWVPSSLQRQPYSTIKFVLSKETCDILCSRGYSVDLRDPYPAYPTTHWLTLSKDQYAIIITFQHILEDGGGKFTIDAEVKLWRTGIQSAFRGASNQLYCHTMSWSDSIYWLTELRPKSVKLSAAEVGTLTVNIKLDFEGHGHYYLCIDVLSDALPTSSAVEPDVDQVESRGGEDQKGLTVWSKKHRRWWS